MNISNTLMQVGESSQCASSGLVQANKTPNKTPNNTDIPSTLFSKNDVGVLVGAIEKANNTEYSNTECQFSIHKETNQIMIKIVEQGTKKVIKEIPSEQILDMVATMCNKEGVFIDEKI